ncbi:MAG TPA: hypothetical protein VF388_10135, partial [Lacunisphaera sp.]
MLVRMQHTLRPRIVIGLLLSVLCLVPAHAKITALTGGRLIDGWGGAPLNNSVILIENERV